MVETGVSILGRPRQKSRPVSGRWQVLDWALLLGLPLLFCVFVLPSLGLHKILDPSDGYYAEGAREMLELQDFLTPHLNYTPWFEKPILIYWLIAASYKVFGVSEFAARLPSAIASALTVAASYWFCRQFVRRRAALFASWLLMSSLMLGICSRMAITDAVLSFLVTSSLSCLLVGIETALLLPVVLGYVALALGVLCKGLVAVVIVALGLGPYVLFVGRKSPGLQQSWARLRPLAGLLILLCISLPWYAIEGFATKGAFLWQFFFQENIQRAMGHVDHKAGFWYYFPVVLGGAFPSTLILLAVPGVVWRSVRRGVSRIELGRSEKLATALSLFCLCLFVFFSALPSKLATYVLPLCVPLAVTAGVTLDRLIRLHSRKSIALLSFSTLALALALFGAAAFLLPRNAQSPFVGQLAAVAIAGCFLLAGILMRYRARKGGLNLLVAAAAGSCFVIVPWGVNCAYQMKCGDFHRLLLYADKLGTTPIILGRRSPSAIFYLRRRVPYARSPQEIVEMVHQAKEPLWLLVDTTCLEHVRAHVERIHNVAHKGHWHLVRAQ